MSNHFEGETGRWGTRLGVASNLINDNFKGKKVYDMGCGGKQLKLFLEDNLYCGLDTSDYGVEEEFIQVDFNNISTYPNIKDNNGLIVCLGLLEYIENVEEFLLFCSQSISYVICSYNVSDKDSLDKRKKLNWVNNYTLKEFKDLVQKFFIIENSFFLQKREYIFILNSKEN